MESGSKMNKKYKYYLFRKSYDGNRIMVYCNRQGDVKAALYSANMENNRVYNRERNRKIHEKMSKQLNDKDIVDAIKYTIEYGDISEISDEYRELAMYLKREMDKKIKDRLKYIDEMRNKND